MKTWKHALSALGAAFLVAACGGGDGTATSSGAGITTIKVVGDSLSDSGVFGFKFAMQGSAAEPMQIWTERIAAQYGAPALCPRYVPTGPKSVALNLSPAAANCTSYGVGGAGINISNTPDNPTAATSGLSIPQQLKDLAAEKAYGAGDLLLVDGGGNDAADLVGAFLKAPFDGGAAYGGLLGTLLPPTVVGTQLAGGDAGAANAGALYMTALADKEILTDILLAPFEAGTGYSYQKLKRKTGDWATAGAAVVMRMSGGVVTQLRIGLTNVAPTALRARNAESALIGQPVNDTTLAAVGQAVRAVCDPAEDLRGDVDYKTAMAAEMTRRAIRAAAARCS